MLNKGRLSKVLSLLAPTGAKQMLVTDPVAVFYLTGRWIHPGERFLGLFIAEGKEPVLFLNDLFRFDGEIGVRKVGITDTTDITALIGQFADSGSPLGVDKTLAARFLIPLLDARIAPRFINTSVAVDNARALKDAEESEYMRESSRINDRAMERFRGLIRAGITEREAAAQCGEIYRELGADSGNTYSFPPIVAFGVNSADPHHEPDDTVLKEGDAVLFDVGCRYHDYCSDMTRTFFYRREPGGEARRVYELVREANERAEEAVRPGVRLSDIDKTAREIITEGGYGPDFTHRLGHFIGIEDHDYGDVSASNDSLAAVSNIFSIEPGIYNKAVLGVRIEDLVQVTEDGCDVLNRYPKTVQVIG